MIDTIAFIECKCCATFQEIKTRFDEDLEEDVIEWDEESTAKAYQEHKCNLTGK